MLKSMIAPSLMCANFKNLQADMEKLNKAKFEYMHVDIMDGTFVRNFTMGPDIIRHVREMTDLPMDIHLMCVTPELHLDTFKIQPGDYISFHYEACTHVERTLKIIRDQYGAKPMLALCPATPLCVLDYVLDSLDGVLLMTVNPGYAGQKLVESTIGKIKRLRTMLDHCGYPHVDIEVDGNTTFANSKRMREAGANIFVAGTSSVFNKGGICENIQKLREVIH
jgi:ribulose-phosphate 3-epimerase